MVPGPTLALFLHATPIIPELCLLLVCPYYASILCTGLEGREGGRDSRWEGGKEGKREEGGPAQGRRG